MNRIFILFSLLASGLVSCVSPRVVDDLETKLAVMERQHADCKEDLGIMEGQLERTKSEMDVMEEARGLLEKKGRALEEDTLIMGRNYRRLKLANKDLNAALTKQLELNKSLAEQSERKNKELYNNLLALQKELAEKEKSLNERDGNLDRLHAELKEREQKVGELQKAIQQRDSTMLALKDGISNALLSYKDKGISVKVEGDKVYVSLEEQILFASGKYNIDSKGETAILDLAKVLNENPDISIMVEGHTDNVPIKTSCMADNYDLSVLRGAEIARILTKKGKVDPKRVIASGRGEYLPVADNVTVDGRKKNRRIEIILTPRIDTLLELINE
ncbi:MAG: OmpA family protein [Bacteroidetes bacterium]|jgi:chemotaxis protein MotB|nr:OmpA family protein [Bacteroidota bacterium]